MIDVQSTLLRRCNIFVKKEDIYTCMCVYAYVYTYIFFGYIIEREKKKIINSGTDCTDSRLQARGWNRWKDPR